jgi:hypothetical protein
MENSKSDMMKAIDNFNKNKMNPLEWMVVIGLGVAGGLLLFYWVS